MERRSHRKTVSLVTSPSTNGWSFFSVRQVILHSELCILHLESTLDQIQHSAFRYFLEKANESNGLIQDHTQPESDASIAAVGFGLAAYLTGVERGFISRPEAARRVLTALRFFGESVQSPSPDATGYKGFYYHFLNLKTGRRAGQSELSLIDTAILLAGMLAAAQYFDHATAVETSIRDLAKLLYERVDWHWALNGHLTACHGWKPESGFLHYGWEGYSEAILLYLLAMGSPSFPLPPTSYRHWTFTYQWESIYGLNHLYAGPLFIHQFSHIWIDFRGLQDRFMREKGLDYFENSRRATCLHREYAIRNPGQFKGYQKNCWGFTAGDGPGNVRTMVDRRERQFFGYVARGAPYGPDDGTISPCGVVASLPFAPEIVLPALGYFQENYPAVFGQFGVASGFNPTWPQGGAGPAGWVSDGFFGVDQGPLILMIENFRSGLIWDLLKGCPSIREGLRRGGFENGWMKEA